MISLLLLTILTTSGGVATADRIDQWLSQAATEAGFSGGVLVSQKGEILLRKGYGMANRQDQTPFEPTTVTTVGSVTKQFTGTAILKLMEMGKLSPEDSLDTFFPNLPPDKQKITVHQLLTHSSGLMDYVGDSDFHMLTNKAYFSQVFATKLRFPPGGGHRYSNAGYSVLTHILEKVSGQSYEDFLRTHLFTPAGMKETGYLKPDWPISRVARGYARGVMDMGTLVARFRQHGRISPVLQGNGGIHSTLDDMHRWYLALRDGKVLSAKSMELLTRPHVAENAEGSSHYGYGWAIFETPRKTKLVAHNGSNGIYFFDFLWLPVEDVLILFATNGYRPGMDNIAWDMEQMLFDPSYNPEPMGPNPYAVIFNFINTKQPDTAPQLLAQLNKDAPLRSPRVLNEVGYRVLEDQPNWAVALFQINTQLFPKEPNVWDSLGEGYLAVGKRAEAVASYRKAADMGLDNAVKMLKQIEADTGKP